MAYEINININGDLDEKQSISGMSATSSANNEVEKAQKRLGKYVASQTIQPFINEVKNAVSQDVGLITGNTALQERINFDFQLVQTGVGIFKNASAGAAIGAATSVGGPVGAIIGVALSVLSFGMQAAFNQVTIDIKKNLENYQLAQTRERAGAAFNRSRRG